MLPVPSELVLIPAGYLAHQGQMNFGLIVLAATVGSLVGASFNYAVAMWLGRPSSNAGENTASCGLNCCARPMLSSPSTARVSTFTGRLIPGIRHLISIPAGLTRMNPGAFAFYTCLGAGLWSFILTLFGYFLGGNEALIKEYQHHITVGVIAFVALIIGGYVVVAKAALRLG